MGTMMPMDFATVLGEEIGSRGFLVPELAKRYTFAGTATLSGLAIASVLCQKFGSMTVLIGDSGPGVCLG
jgi:hypothetical protein